MADVRLAGCVAILYLFVFRSSQQFRPSPRHRLVSRPLQQQRSNSITAHRFLSSPRLIPALVVSAVPVFLSFFFQSHFPLSPRVSSHARSPFAAAAACRLQRLLCLVRRACTRRPAVPRCRPVPASVRAAPSAFVAAAPLDPENRAQIFCGAECGGGGASCAHGGCAHRAGGARTLVRPSRCGQRIFQRSWGKNFGRRAHRHGQSGRRRPDG